MSDGPSRSKPQAIKITMRCHVMWRRSKNGEKLIVDHPPDTFKVDLVEAKSEGESDWAHYIRLMKQTERDFRGGESGEPHLAPAVLDGRQGVNATDPPASFAKRRKVSTRGPKPAAKGSRITPVLPDA